MENKKLWGCRLIPEPGHSPITRYIKALDEETVKEFVWSKYPQADIIKSFQVSELVEQSSGAWDMFADPLLPSPKQEY